MLQARRRWPASARQAMLQREVSVAPAHLWRRCMYGSLSGRLHGQHGPCTVWLRHAGACDWLRVHMPLAAHYQGARFYNSRILEF